MTHRAEELASKAMGSVKVMKATVVGLKGVFKTLLQEHGEVAGLLLRVKMSSDPELRRELFPLIRQQLLSHEQAELQVVYPAFRAHPDTRDMATHHDQEATRLKTLIYDLTAIDVGSAAWGSTLNKLIEVVEHHVREEENEYFPAGQRAFGREADELLVRYQRAKTEAISLLAAV